VRIVKNIEIIGGKRLSGKLRIHGAKNSVLPIIAGAMLNSGKTVIKDCPNLSDVHSAFNILRNLGCKVALAGNVAEIDAEDVTCSSIPDDLMKEMRSSVMFLGAIISRCGNACISCPGGCDLGPRPIDLHIKAFRELGVEIEETEKYIYCKKNSELFGGNICLDFPSVGATENIMLLTAKSDGVTIIDNPAKEPEIVDLQNFLNSMGADISGAGTDKITIRGVRTLRDTIYTVIPDRIAASTYLCAAAGCGGEVTLLNVVPQHIDKVIWVLRNAGCYIFESENAVKIISDGKLKAVSGIETHPHPGFPTDVQAPVMAALSMTQGTTIFIENLFKGRFRHVAELQKMGADITRFNQVAAVRGVERLSGAEVVATDLRGGAALVIAGLMAEGKTIISDILHIDRGYEHIEKDLALLGANIRRV